MKRVVLLALLTLALPMLAFANSNLVFTNAGGSIQLKSGGLTGIATLTSFTSNGGTISGTNLGSVSYSTGLLTSHPAPSGGVDTWTFAAGGSFSIVGNGKNGIPTGTLFTGTFTSPVTFIGKYNPAGNNGLGAWTYQLTGQIAGKFAGGSQALGGTAQFTFDVRGGKPFSKSVRGNTGITSVSAVPEPGTLGLLGTGLIGVAGLVRRKFRSIA